MKLSCRIGWHHWSAWSKKYVEIWHKFESTSGATIIGSAFDRIFQDRRCQDCRTVEKKEIKA